MVNRILLLGPKTDFRFARSRTDRSGCGTSSGAPVTPLQIDRELFAALDRPIPRFRQKRKRTASREPASVDDRNGVIRSVSRVSLYEPWLHIDTDDFLSTMRVGRVTPGRPKAWVNSGGQVLPGTPLSNKKRASSDTTLSPGSSKSLQQALRILFHFRDSGPELGLAQLASALCLNKTALYRR